MMFALLRLSFFAPFVLLLFSFSSICHGADSPGNKQINFDEAPISILRTTGEARGALHYTVELAIRMDQRARGLMFRQHMDRDRGMLFFFEQDRRVTMWMKNTYIPLDILFVNKKGEIVTIAANAKPLSLDIISSGVPVISVLELNGGEAARQKIQLGDRIIHPFFTKK